MNKNVSIPNKLVKTSLYITSTNLPHQMKTELIQNLLFYKINMRSSNFNQYLQYQFNQITKPSMNFNINMNNELNVNANKHKSSQNNNPRVLFKKEEEHFFYNFESYDSEDPYDHSNTLSSDVDIEPQHSFKDSKLDFLNFSESDENEDYDLMFSSQIEPVVGSYAELGLFLTNTNQLVM